MEINALCIMKSHVHLVFGSNKIKPEVPIGGPDAGARVSRVPRFQVNKMVIIHFS